MAADFAGESEATQKITPVLMFVGKVCGKTQEAADFCTSVFKGSPDGARAAGAHDGGSPCALRRGRGTGQRRYGKIRVLRG